MKDKPVVFVDVDETCALHHPVWLERYNKEYNDNLSTNDITDWGLHKFVKPECGDKIYKYLKDPTMYDTIIPIEDAKWGVEQLREIGFRVLFATACSAEVSGRKFFWLKEWGFIKKERDYIEIRDKSLLRGRFMIDDCYDYVNGFVGYGYLLTKPWNEKYNWYHRVKDWIEFIEIMKDNYRRGL